MTSSLEEKVAELAVEVRSQSKRIDDKFAELIRTLDVSDRQSAQVVEFVRELVNRLNADLAELKALVATQRQETRNDLNDARRGLSAEVTGLRTDLERQIRETEETARELVEWKANLTGRIAGLAAGISIAVTALGVTIAKGLGV